MDLTQEILFFREGEHWIAAWRRYDMVAQGKTREEAYQSFCRIIVAQCLLDAAEGRLPFSDVPLPPPEVLARWEAAAALEGRKVD
jgi:hypothetical protein